MSFEKDLAPSGGETIVNVGVIRPIPECLEETAAE